LFGLRSDNLDLAEVAQSFAGERIHGLLFVSEELNVAATRLQKVGGVFCQTTDQDVEISVAEQVRSVAAVWYAGLIGSCEHQ